MFGILGKAVKGALGGVHKAVTGTGKGIGRAVGAARKPLRGGGIAKRVVTRSPLGRR